MASTHTPEQNKAVVRALYENVLNTGRLELLDDLIADDFVGVNGARGPAGFAATVTGLRQAFPDIQWTVEDVVAEDDKVVIRWTWHGTHHGAFRGYAASHNAVTNHAIAMYELRDTKIVHTWIESDQLGFLQQIGVVPHDLSPGPQAQP